MSLTSICVCTYERTQHLTQVFQFIAKYCARPYEIVVVDDASKNTNVLTILEHFKREFEKEEIDFTIHVNEKNSKHAASQNTAWKIAKGEVLTHIEDDILIPHDGWNQEIAKFFEDHPEVGQVIPEGSGRGEWIPIGPYREFMWGLGGFFAIPRKVFEQVGGWDERLVHQVEPDYNLQVRMAGYRLAEIPGIRMAHLGEGDQADTFKRQAQILVGLHTMLLKWNKRFMGTWDYRDVWSMSWDDFPPNVAFRRRLAAWFAGEAQKLKERFPSLDAMPSEVRKAYEDISRCELNSTHSQVGSTEVKPGPEPFKYPGHWGQFELIKRIRPQNREREQELIGLMRDNFVFKDVRQIEKQLRECAARMKYEATEEEIQKLASTVPLDFKWEAKAIYAA